MDKENIEIKPAFRERYEKLTNWNAFIDVSLQFLRRSIRVNTIKSTIADVKKSLDTQGWNLTPVPWCKEGFFVEHRQQRRDIGNCREHGLGYFYVQEAASMIPPIVLEPKPEDIILDMCASPGSKATQIGMYMQNKGCLVANDITGVRLQPLGINLQRCGLTNSVITMMNGLSFRKGEYEFDRVLVDAPCSGTGTIRKSFKTFRIWNPLMIRRLSVTQKKLLQKGFDLLKPGGVVVYSTCTLEPQEDEEVVSALLENNDNASLEEIKLDIKKSKTVKEFDGKKYDNNVKKCLRLWPQDNDTEGFFVAKIKKYVS